MKIIFTVCSNNYLAQAKTLGDSLMKHNPGYYFVICLTDRLAEGIDYGFFDPYRILPVEDIGIEGFEEMFCKYNITELNTALKPFFFQYLFKEYEAAGTIIYLDADILIYDKFLELEQQLRECSIILTPHIFTPVDDHCHPSETTVLNVGMYNLGFIAVKRSAEGQEFLQWWMIRLKDQCFIDLANGMFVDQLWLNFAPLFFKNVLLLRHLGYNAAYWNLHERKVVVTDGRYTINNQFPLVFFHFSGYKFDKPKVLSRYQNRYSFEQRTDVVPLFKEYQELVMNNDHLRFSGLECYYVRAKQTWEAEQRTMSATKRLVGTLKRKTKNILKAVRS